MPRRDATGPIGIGSKTGRGLGTCNDIKANDNSQSAKKFLNNENLLEEKRMLEEKLKSIEKKLKNN